MGGIWNRQIRHAREVLAALNRAHGRSLDHEALRILMAEVEAVVNSKPLTLDTFSDADSQIPVSPRNKLTMKSNVVIQPPENFKKYDLYCRKSWRIVLHITNRFWSRCRKEFLVTLQSVLLWDDQAQNQWSMVWIIETERDQQQVTQSFQVKVSGSKSNGMLRRLISKLFLLISNDNLDDTLWGSIKRKKYDSGGCKINDWILGERDGKVA